jgi:hypothetical protein
MQIWMNLFILNSWHIAISRNAILKNIAQQTEGGYPPSIKQWGGGIYPPVPPLYETILVYVEIVI